MGNANEHGIERWVSIKNGPFPVLVLKQGAKRMAKSRTTAFFVGRLCASGKKNCSFVHVRVFGTWNFHSLSHLEFQFCFRKGEVKRKQTETEIPKVTLLF
jgi:hypothetical protein